MTKKTIKGIVHPYGLVRSKNVVLMPLDYSNHSYYVSDFWTTTQYPKTPEGLIAAKKHVQDDLLITAKNMEILK
jgi:hypothetical protein